MEFNTTDYGLIKIDLDEDNDRGTAYLEKYGQFRKLFYESFFKYKFYFQDITFTLHTNNDEFVLAATTTKIIGKINKGSLAE